MKVSNTDIILSFINKARYTETREDLNRELDNVETCLRLFQGEVLEGANRGE